MSDAGRSQSLLGARWRLRLFAAACVALRLTDAPRFRFGRHVYRLTLWLLDQRYQAANALGGRDFARTYDYIPF